MTWKFPAIVVLYAAALLAIGFTAMNVSPPGANAATAIIVPALFAALMIACLVLAFLIKRNRTLGMIGIHAALAIPLIVTAGTASRLVASINNANTFNQQLAEIHDALVTNDNTPDHTVHLFVAPPQQPGDAATPAELRDNAPELYLNARLANGTPIFQSEEAAQWRPIAYQAVSLAATAALSVLAFVALIAQRPKVPKPEPKPEPKPDRPNNHNPDPQT